MGSKNTLVNVRKAKKDITSQAKMRGRRVPGSFQVKILIFRGREKDPILTNIPFSAVLQTRLLGKGSCSGEVVSAFKADGLPNVVAHALLRDGCRLLEEPLCDIP